MFRFFICVAMSGTAAVAGWPREQGSAIDYPAPHSTAYFRGDPCLRPSEDSIFRADCAYQGDSKEWSEAQAELVEIGKIGKFTIYDLYYDRTLGPYPGDGMKKKLSRRSSTARSAKIVGGEERLK